jgi:hypothetical protein
MHHQRHRATLIDAGAMASPDFFCDFLVDRVIAEEYHPANINKAVDEHISSRPLGERPSPLARNSSDARPSPSPVGSSIVFPLVPQKRHNSPEADAATPTFGGRAAGTARTNQSPRQPAGVAV